MEQERWRKIEELMQETLDLESGERAAFLERECGGDAELRDEVERLLALDDGEFSLIERPALEVAAAMLAPEPGGRSGHAFGCYEIRELLGTGGMGEVYLALDTRLGRNVALKLLPQDSTGDADRVRRFQKEARAASALNHPNIVTIYEVGEHDGCHFIATEHVEGETLRRRMGRGPIAAGEALEIAIQTASALAAAHRAGIIHRDVKPENLMLRPDGYVKVLDFGLAKLGEHALPGGDLTDSTPGLVMGTVRYMSPEQARGTGIDARTDVFSLGVVLYEMLAGCRPFEAGTASDVIVQILTSEPRRITHDAPGALEPIVRRALAKNREERYESAGELLADLKGLARALDLQSEETSPRTDASGVASTATDRARVDAPAVDEPSSAPRTLDSGTEPVGGAVPLDSRFYVVRPVDGELRETLKRRDSVVLIKGARHTGKTSLLARGLEFARAGGARVVLTDLQAVGATGLESLETLVMTLARVIASQLRLDPTWKERWDRDDGPIVNFDCFVENAVLPAVDGHLVWGLDEADRLLACRFGNDVFGLFRAWHNRRSLDPGGPWQRLTLAIAYATEAHLFISDANQSPFNVGTHLELEDLDDVQVAELNRRYGSPLERAADLLRLRNLVGGQPYLVHRSLDLCARGLDLARLEAIADRDDGPLGDHLRRLLATVARQPELDDALREVMKRGVCATAESFYRLRAAGLVAGETSRTVRLRCPLYGAYFERHFQCE